MRAITVSSFGPAEVLTDSDSVVPDPGEGEGSIEVEAARSGDCSLSAMPAAPMTGPSAPSNSGYPMPASSD